MVMAEVSSIEAVTGDGPSGAFRAFWESTLLADGGAAMVIYLSGRFDYTTYRQFTEVLGQAWQTAQAAGVTELVLDLGHVSYMDSSALGMMLEARHQVQELASGLVILQGATGVVRKVLEFANFQRLFVLRDK